MLLEDIDGHSVPMGLEIWGKSFAEPNLVKWVSAMESLFQFDCDFEPQFHNYNTTKIPFDARWPGYSCSIESLDHLVCEAELAK